MLCPALSWPSPAHAVRVAGAKVRFVDVDQAEWNSTAEALREARNGNTRAAIVIDQFGNPARAEEIRGALGALADHRRRGVRARKPLHERPMR